eukprot:SAG11_NODE_2563_length_3218_cov_8.710484_5_plen_339_part_00
MTSYSLEIRNEGKVGGVAHGQRLEFELDPDAQRLDDFYACIAAELCSLSGVRSAVNAIETWDSEFEEWVEPSGLEDIAPAPALVPVRVHARTLAQSVTFAAAPTVKPFESSPDKVERAEDGPPVSSPTFPPTKAYGARSGPADGPSARTVERDQNGEGGAGARDELQEEFSSTLNDKEELLRSKASEKLAQLQAVDPETRAAALQLKSKLAADLKDSNIVGDVLKLKEGMGANEHVDASKFVDAGKGLLAQASKHIGESPPLPHPTPPPVQAGLSVMRRPRPGPWQARSTRSRTLETRRATSSAAHSSSRTTVRAGRRASDSRRWRTGSRKRSCRRWS